MTHPPLLWCSQLEVAEELDAFEAQVDGLQAELKDKNDEIVRLEDESIKLKVPPLGPPIDKYTNICYDR